VLEEARQELEIVRTPGRLVQTPRKSISKLARSSRWLPNDFSCSSCYKANLLAGHPRLDERYPEIFRTARMLVEAPISSPMKHFISRHGRKRNPYDWNRSSSGRSTRPNDPFLKSWRPTGI